MTVNPASLYHLPAADHGGRAADLVLFDPEEKWTPQTYASLSSNTPFTGWELYGRVQMTICQGVVAYNLSLPR